MGSRRLLWGRADYYFAAADYYFVPTDNYFAPADYTILRRPTTILRRPDTILCRRRNNGDALIYIWRRALYVSEIIIALSDTQSRRHQDVYNRVGPSECIQKSVRRHMYMSASPLLRRRHKIVVGPAQNSSRAGAK